MLCGEAELPYALLGYATDYANGVKPDEPTPVEELVRLVAASTETFARALAAAVPRVDARRPSRSGPISAGTDALGAAAAVVVGALAAPARPGARRAARRRRRAGAARARSRARARRWAAAVAPGRAFEATTLGAAEAALARPRRARPAGRARRPGARRSARRAPRSTTSPPAATSRSAPPTTRGPTSSPSRARTPSCSRSSSARSTAGSSARFAERGVTLGMLRHERRLASAGRRPRARARPARAARPRRAGARAFARAAAPVASATWSSNASRKRPRPRRPRTSAATATTTLDYIERDSRPAGISDEAWRPVEEAGGGEAEGFEEAEAELIERAENPHGPSPIADAGECDEEAAALDAEYGEADEEHTSEDEPEDERPLS